jgi:hypothetical protein
MPLCGEASTPTPRLCELVKCSQTSDIIGDTAANVQMKENIIFKKKINRDALSRFRHYW